MKFPDTWAPQPKDANGKEVTMHMFDVPEDSTEYKEVLDRFYETTDSSTVTIISLKRVQNLSEYRKHMAFLEAISRKHYKKKIDVRRLFHGCGEKSIEPIAVQGFNRNYAATSNGMLQLAMFSVFPPGGKNFSTQGCICLFLPIMVKVVHPWVKICAHITPHFYVHMLTVVLFYSCLLWKRCVLCTQL